MGFLFFFHACKMKTIAAYLLAVLGGNKTPSEDDVKRILEAAAANVDAEAISKIVSELSGKSVYDVMDEGAERLVAVSTGSRGAAAGGAAAGGAAAEEAPKEEAPAEEEEEESDEDMGFGLFD